MQYRSETRSSYVLYWLLVLLPIYQDSAMAKYLGAAGYSIITPLSFVFFLYILVFKQRGVIKRQEETHKLFILGYWLLIISFIGLLVWLLMGNPIYYMDEFLPVKAIKVILQYLSYPIYTYSLLSCGKKLKQESELFIPVYFCLIIITVIAIIEKAQIPYAFQSLHYSGPFPYYRVRLLTTESSFTALPIFVYSGLSIYYGISYNKKLIFVSAIGCCIIQFFLSGSKSLAITLAFVIICYLLISLKRLNKKTIFGLALIVLLSVVFAIMVLPRTIDSTQGDIKNYSSVATRMYTAIIGIIIGVYFPCGVGCAAYLGVFQTLLRKYMSILNRLPFDLNTNEIISIAYSNTDQAVSVKSGILQFNIYWGIIGTIYLAKIFKNLSNKTVKVQLVNNEIIRTILWTTIIMMIISCNFQYEFWMMYAIIGGMIHFKITNESMFME